MNPEAGILLFIIAPFEISFSKVYIFNVILKKNFILEKSVLNYSPEEIPLFEILQIS